MRETIEDQQFLMHFLNHETSFINLKKFSISNLNGDHITDLFLRKWLQNMRQIEELNLSLTDVNSIYNFEVKSMRKLIVAIKSDSQMDPITSKLMCLSLYSVFQKSNLKVLVLDFPFISGLLLTKIAAQQVNLQILQVHLHN